MKVLVTGTTGFLASRLRDALLAEDAFEVLAPGRAELDITDGIACRRWFERNRPDAVFHLAAVSDVRACAADEEHSFRVNVEGPANLASCLREFSEGGETPGRFLFASSDQVYTANHTDWRINREDDPLAPGNVYGRQKLLAEERVLSVLPDAYCVRLPWMFDLKPGKDNFIRRVVSCIRTGTPAEYAVNELRGLGYAAEVAENMIRLMGSGAPGGAYNFGPPASGSSFDTAEAAFVMAGEVLGLPWEGLARPVRWECARSLAMDPGKLSKTGIAFRETAESIRYCLEREEAFLHESGE